MKFKDLVLSACSNLGRSKGRTSLTIVAIVIGAFTIALTTGINIGVNKYIDKQINGVGGERQLTIYPKQDHGFGNDEGPMIYEEGKGQAFMEQKTLTDKDVAKIKDVNGLTSVKPAIYVTTDYIKGKAKDKFVIDTAPNMEQMKIDIDQGRQVSDGNSEYEITIAPDYVKALGFKNSQEAVGQMVELAATSAATNEQKILQAKIVGVANETLIQAGRSLINDALSTELQSINQEGLPDSMKGEYMVVVSEMSGDLSAKSIDKLKQDLSEKGYDGQTVDDEIGMIRSVINAITGVLTMFGAIALFAASFGIINTLYMSVQERTREIGLMKAMGMSGTKIFSMFSIEATLIGLLGSVLGIGLAVGVGALINQVAADSFLSNLTGLTLIQFSWPTTGVIVLIISGIAFLSGTLPASRAAKQDPIEALRYE